MVAMKSQLPPIAVTILAAFTVTILQLPKTLTAQTLAEAAPSPAIDEASRFIFHSVLEGLYEDGLTEEDVSRILLRRDGETYYHFIYACPVCQATIWALEAYRERPSQLYGMKRPISTFGPGAEPEVRRDLSSTDASRRLVAINTLVRRWIDRRIARHRLTEPEREELLASFDAMRKEGMKWLETYQAKESRDPMHVSRMAPAFATLRECAACNAVTGRPMALPR